jgi:hypothetical protein
MAVSSEKATVIRIGFHSKMSNGRPVAGFSAKCLSDGRMKLFSMEEEVSFSERRSFYG